MPLPATSIEDRLRTFLFALAAAMCLGTIVELALANHTKQAIQWLPFGLCAAGLAAVAAAWLRPTRASLWSLRLVMGAATGSGGLGWFVMINKQNLEIPTVFAGIIGIMLVGSLFELLFKALERLTVGRWGMLN